MQWLQSVGPSPSTKSKQYCNKQKLSKSKSKHSFRFAWEQSLGSGRVRSDHCGSGSCRLSMCHHRSASGRQGSPSGKRTVPTAQSVWGICLAGISASSRLAARQKVFSRETGDRPCPCFFREKNSVASYFSCRTKHSSLRTRCGIARGCAARRRQGTRGNGGPPSRGRDGLQG